MNAFAQTPGLCLDGLDLQNVQIDASPDLGDVRFGLGMTELDASYGEGACCSCCLVCCCCA